VGKRWVILAGEEAGPISNKLGGIWNVIEDETKTLAAMILSGEIKEDIRILVAGPYYGYSGADWNTGQNRITDLGGLEPLGKDKDLQKALDETALIGVPIKTAARKIDGIEIDYVLFETPVCHEVKIEYKGEIMRYCDAVKKEAYDLVKLNSLEYEATGYGREYTHYLTLSTLLSEFARNLAALGKVSLQCHEYGVFYAGARLELQGVPISTMATLHATKVGRTLGAKALDQMTTNNASWPSYAPKGLAELEKLAKYFDAVTFVGDTTRMEAKLFYGLDGIIVRNGIDVESDEINWEKKKSCRAKIQNYLAEHLYEHYDGEKLDPENILPIFTISRMEIENKGYPDLLDALVLYDRVMQNHIVNGKIDEDVRTVCFLITAHGPKDKSRLPKGFPIYLPEELLVGEELKLKKMVYEHELHVRDLSRKRRVTSAVLYPQWVGKDDGGLNMAVDEIAAGCIAAVFPSKYEPFLLTGLEAGREATPVVVARTCGFSDAVREYKDRKGMMGGVIVVDNLKLPYLEVITDYAMGLESITKTFLRDRSKYKMMCAEALQLAKDMSWKEPVKKYYEIMSHEVNW